MGFLSDLFTSGPITCEDVDKPASAITDEPGYLGGTRCYDEDGHWVGSTYGGGAVNGTYLDENGEPVEASIGVNSAKGVWKDEDGDINRGLQIDAQLAKVKTQLFGNDNGGVNFDGSVLDGVAEAVVDENEGASIGGQANLVSGALELESTGTKNDQSIRVGGSIGAGAAARVHWEDADGDRRPEYGIGVDAGPLSVDVKTEDPVRLAAQVLSGGFIGSSTDPERSNWTDAVYGEDQQGTRGAASTFGDMGAAELTMNAMFNDGMNPERRREVIDERIESVTSLFGGLF